jgi:hypothetical protein
MFCVHFQGYFEGEGNVTMKMEPEYSSEMLVICQATWHHITEGYSLNSFYYISLHIKVK